MNLKKLLKKVLTHYKSYANIIVYLIRNNLKKSRKKVKKVLDKKKVQ